MKSGSQIINSFSSHNFRRSLCVESSKEKLIFWVSRLRSVFGVRPQNFHVVGKVNCSAYEEAPFPRRKGKESSWSASSYHRDTSCRISFAFIRQTMSKVIFRGGSLWIGFLPAHALHKQPLTVFSLSKKDWITTYQFTRKVPKGARRQPIGILYHQQPSYHIVHTFAGQFEREEDTFVANELQTVKWRRKKVEIFIFDGTLPTIYSRRGFFVPSGCLRCP